MLQRHALRCWEALEGGKGLCGRGEAERAFDQVERSIADEYTVETELPRQAAAGRKTEYPEYPCALNSSTVVRLAEHP
jgi:hypothetical protein